MPGPYQKQTDWRENSKVHRMQEDVSLHLSKVQEELLRNRAFQVAQSVLLIGILSKASDRESEGHEGHGQKVEGQGSRHGEELPAGNGGSILRKRYHNRKAGIDISADRKRYGATIDSEVVIYIY